MLSKWTGFPRTVAMLVMISWIILNPCEAGPAEALDENSDVMPNYLEKDAEFRYRTGIVGVNDKALLKQLQSASLLMSLEGRPPPSLVALERRIRNDIERLQKVLRSEAYYDSAVEYRVEADKVPAGVVVDITHGARYLLQQYTVTYSGPVTDDPGLSQEPEGIGVKLGEPARAQLVTGAQQRLLESLADIGHPLAEVVNQSVIVDHADYSMSVMIEITAGELSHFGSLEVVGASSVEVDYIESFVTWQEGEVFDRRKLNQVRHQLLATGLFSEVVFERPKQVDADGKLSITIRVEERKHRSIGVAGRWSTDEGFAFEGQWEHRNIFGRQEHLSLSAEIGEIKQEFLATFKKPHYLRRKQDLLASGALAHEDTDAFSGPLTRYFVGLQRQITEKWNIVGGVPIEYSNLSDLQGSRQFFLYGLELSGRRDTANDRFNPYAGTRLQLSANPYYGNGENSVDFITGQMGLSGYHAIDAGKRYTLAARTRIGSTVGESTESLPANKRFYAGGGSSIRGYKFQSVGPLGPGYTPLGGRSLFEVSAELRIKFTDTLGGAVFFDGGNVYDDEVPDFSTDLQWAFGIGARYYTAFGPLRLDFGFPINPRDGIDDPVQFYISIGQAF